jgi:uncharacterized SAM-binding protein YcdF (DUF218 family)
VEATARSVGGWGRDAALGACLGALGAFLGRDLGLGFPAPAWIAGALAGAVLSRVGLGRILAAVVLGLAAAWCAVALTPLTRGAAEGLVRRDALERADAVLVLGSRLQKDGEPTASALSRLLHGLELVRQGWAPRLILPELHEPAARYAPVARRRMATLAVEAELVTIGPVGRTRDEAVFASRLCRERGLCRLLVVTSPTHSRRACAALEREGLRVVSSPAIETRFDVETLERPEERLPAFGSVVHERLGLLYYRRRGWID